MKPWIGVVATAAAIFVAPATALAGPDDPALVKFQLESSAKYDDFEALGFNMDHAVEDGEGASVIVSAWVTDDQIQQARAAGFENVGVVHDKFNIDAVRREMNATVEAEEAAKEALADAAAGKQSRSAAPKSVRAQRADFYENNLSRYLSIEANADGVSFTCVPTPTGENCTYNGPTLMAEWFDANGNKMGQGQLGVYRDPDVSPDYYQYHYSIFRLGDVGDGKPDPATIRIASSNGDVDTLTAKEWIAKDPPSYTSAPGFRSGFMTRYLNGQEAHKRVRDLAAEFPNISEAIKLPEQTRGYMRKAQTMLGYYAVPNEQNPNPFPDATRPYVMFDEGNRPVAGLAPATGQTPDLVTPESIVVLTSRLYGHLGGNSLTARIVPPTAANQSLSVSLVGNAIRINPATDASGAITSTAAQVVDAVNAHADASQLVVASKYRTFAGNGVVKAGPVSPLSDLLRAPASVPRGPMDQYAIRIGKQRDGSKVGVFFYCQEHGNEIATSGVCIETAERLVRNYGTDPKTTELVDNLDIFIVPQINPDGATHSLYDSNRRKNLSHHCDDTSKFGNNIDPANRNSWGVDLNRNFSIGSIFDGFQGASATNCLSGNFAGLNEFSEPEARNESWVQTTFRNIKFANNIHSSGGYFMWPPGAYTPQREPLPYPPYGTLNFFDQAAKQVLDGIKSHRKLAVRPQKTGPVIDVLYSAAGNSADEAYYKNGIIGYDFEIGDSNNEYKNPATGEIVQCSAGQQPPFGDSTNDCLDNEGFHESMEFASGNYGLMQSALDYANDVTPPVVEAVTGSIDGGKIDVRFTSNEASSIYYTLDGSTPTTASTEWKPNRARALPLPLQLAPNTVLKWIAVDFKGNASAVKTKAFGFTEGTVGGSVPATLSLTLNGAPSFSPFIPGVANTYTASTTASVTSTAGNATLTVGDPSSVGTGHLVNGSYVMAQPLKAQARMTGTAPHQFYPVGSSAAPLNMFYWSAPVTGFPLTIEFQQTIGANDPLRTGTYAKPLTFTLSTTQP
ncbi:chitobiase/beta-hexosaminidase C-terminal domain-containing protein [Solirubrobacter sp. CPCC 204708]|uniref:M14 family zinc carboxypeptidase n=1 Tax=Solirubrobacter deserti TaxID=2282478 RepID=A0ABT4RNW2_9ACTN|nr:M14 family zinc carboxypeptidase [Solirubrobacter deserti]MBE2319259.1 chitobiase/beta-hexosaminidase C-terminal domain-containing protein [Solirubrobacter deserti]MDA0140265.1 M14 family zinc carboxypeptidase [Solirubrobacter deserti]